MTDNENPYAVEDLAEFMRLAKRAEKPFIFITGAGCSVTAGIPLAQKIVSELNKKFALELKPLSDEDRKDYGKCMGRLEISKRREYLQKYISKAKINWAHIALACLMKAGYVRRVMTFNFDNLLARSCGLLGQYPPTYDFTAANLNLHRLIDDPAIVHLHGQGHGFVQLNTESETEEHATRLKEFVGHTLSESPTLFIGYSGKNDAFLPQIEEQFSDQHRLFWVDMGDQAPDHLQRKLLSSRLAHYMSCENGADLFLIQLARELGCFPPTIFADPYQHLLDELDEIADYPISKEESSEDKKENRSTLSNTSAQDILLGTKNKLKEVQQQDKEEETNFLEEYLQGNYEEVVQALEEKQQLNFEQSLWLVRSYFSLALREPTKLEQISIYDRLIEKFKENNDLDIQELVAKALVNKGATLSKLEEFEETIDVCNELIAKFGESEESVLQETVARTLMNKGIILGKLGQVDQEVSVYDELIAKFDESDELILQEQVATAMINKGITLGGLEQSDKALTVYDELIAKFNESNELILQEKVAKAMINKGLTLGELEQPGKALDVYDELIAKFGNSGEPALQRQVARSLMNKGIILGKLGQVDQEVSVYDELIAKFDESDELILQEQVATAMINKGITLGELEQSDKALTVYDELIAKFNESNELILQEKVAKAMINKGVTLGELEQPGKEVEIYSELITKFGESKEQVLQEQVANALNGRGYLQLIIAKKQWENRDTAQIYLNQALVDLLKAREMSSENNSAIVFGNLSYTYFLQGKISESEKYLREALKQGKQDLYEGTIEDMQEYPIDLDKDFKVLLDKIWYEVKD